MPTGHGEARDDVADDVFKLVWVALAVVVVGLVVLAAVGGVDAGSMADGALVDEADSPSPVVVTVAPPSLADDVRGLTFGGADFGIGENLGTGGGDVFSNEVSGTLWAPEQGGDYRYPDRESLGFLGERGIGTIRLTLRWERIHPDLDGGLDSEELRLLVASVEDAAAVGIDVIPTLMNYGAYWQMVDGVGVRRSIGSAELPSDRLAETWRLLASALSEHDNVVAYALMNEPVDVVGGAAGWESATVEAATAIRTVDRRTAIAVPTYQWSNVHRVGREHPAGPWMPASAEPVVYETHQYFSGSRSGAYGGYEEELAAAVDDGWVGSDGDDALVRRSVADLAAFVAWLNGAQGWIGEVGWPNDRDVEQWNALGDRWFGAADDAGLWVTMWTTGSFWRNDYHLLVYRSTAGAGGSLDAATPVAEVLERHLDP